MLRLLVLFAVTPTVEALEPPVGCLQHTRQLVTSQDARLEGPVLVIQKEARRLQWFRDGRAVAVEGTLACWRIGLGGQPEGTKVQRGDQRTPEGWYRTSDKPWSSFYGAIAVHYPNVEDARRGRQAGLITEAQQKAILAALASGQKPVQSTRLGGEILLHGGGSDRDWTLGCVAMEDADLDRLRDLLPPDQEVHLLILP